MPIRSVTMYCLVAAMAIILFVSYAIAADNEFSYKVSFNGISDKTLLSDIQSISDSLSNVDHQIAGQYLLQKMADSDIRKFQLLLRSRGFYNASIQSSIKLTKKTFELTFKFDQGEPYFLKSVGMEFTQESESQHLTLPDAEKLGLIINKTFKSSDVLDAQEGLIKFLRKKGFPLAKIADREVVVDHKDRSVSVSFKIDTGPNAVFGHTTISGLVKVDESYVAGKLPWKEGDPFDGDLIEEARKAISGLGLFASIRITEANEVNEGSLFPVTIDVTERKHKSISAGLNYITNQGPGVKLAWENRNLFHQGEKLTTKYEFSNQTVSAEGTFRKQDFLAKNQTFRFSLRLGRDDTDAYNSKSLVGSVFLDRDLTKKLRVGAGVTLKSSKVEQLAIINRFNSISFPLYCNVDTTNDLLDPVRGNRISLEVTPFHEVTGSGMNFAKVIASYKLYKIIVDKPFVVIACDIKTGFIKGAGRKEIPADERLYSGGGGSIRGYSFQSVGPLVNGDPVGGRSLFEVSTELRLKITEHYGLATFLDGGSAFAESLFTPRTAIHWGTGLGMRYYTPVGPLRLDVGIPLNRRPGIDSPYQIYLSLGQAF
jgi:translocation and assembly module TamA